jgi:homoserine O-acetyltransferase
MHDQGDDPGWWDIAVGPGKAIDTNRYFVVCPNLLGGCRGTTGPGSVNPATGKPYGRDFPTITIGDMVEAQRRLLTHLGIKQLVAVVGGSMGGQMVLHWAAKHPGMVRGAIALATTGRLSTQALAFDVVGRNAILTDPDFHGGDYYRRRKGPGRGLAIARMIGHITYLSPEAMKAKFEANRLKPREVPTEFEKRFSVGSYLGYQGDKFVERFDANSYVALDGNGPVRHGPYARAARHEPGLQFVPVAGGQLQQRLAFPARAVAGHRPGLARRRKGRELLQRPKRLRSRRIPAAQ